MLMVFLAEIFWICASARIASAAEWSRPIKNLDDRAAIDADPEFTMSLPLNLARAIKHRQMGAFFQDKRNTSQA